MRSHKQINMRSHKQTTKTSGNQESKNFHIINSIVQNHFMLHLLVRARSHNQRLTSVIFKLEYTIELKYSESYLN